MSEQDAKAQVPNVRGRIDQLYAMMAEALDIEARIVGQQLPSSEGPVLGAADLVLDVVEFDLDRALDRMSDIVTQLKRIERRL